MKSRSSLKRYSPTLPLFLHSGLIDLQAPTKVLHKEVPTLANRVETTISEYGISKLRHRIRLPGFPVSVARCSIAATYPPQLVKNASLQQERTQGFLLR